MTAMNEPSSRSSADAAAQRAQAVALVPYPLATSALTVNRADAVIRFKKWILNNPDRAETPLTLHQLGDIDELPSRNTLGRYFKASECHGSPWHALCYMAMEAYLLDEDPLPPQALRDRHSEYQHWLTEAQRGSEGLQLSELKRKDDEHLLKIIEKADATTDVLELTTAARIHIKRLHDRLLMNSLWGPKDFVLAREAAVNAAESICAISERVIDELIWPQREHLALQVRRNCAAIIDATVDARRLLSRDGERQFAELGLLLTLRNKDADLTKGVRTEADRAMVEYNIRHTDALITRRDAAAAEKEMKATETLLHTLTEIRAFALRDDVFRLSAVAPPINAAAAAKLVEVAARLASYMVAYAPTTTSPGVSAQDVERGRAFSERADACAKLLRDVIDPDLDTSVVQDRADVVSLLQAARRPGFVVNPPTALRILRFRGIGEMLIARMLTNIATGEPSHDDRHTTTGYLRTGDDVEPDPSPYGPQERRTMLMKRAESLYLRSIDWQRGAGAPKRLRELAAAELEELQRTLSQRPTPIETEHGHTPTPRTLEEAITRLRADLDQMIVEGVLWADLRHLNELSGDSALRATRLINTMTEATRFLKEPEVGLRTDLPPTRPTPR